MRLVPLLVALAACTRYDIEPREAVHPSTAFFRDISAASGIQVGNYTEDPPAGMVINDHSRLAFADLDGDGFDDIVMHSLFPNADRGVPFEHLVFLANGDGTFTDHSDASGLRHVQAAFFAFGDLDNDGDQDLYAGLDLATAGTSSVWLNDGSGRFTEVPDPGPRHARAAGAVIADVDGDAILDLFVAHGSTMYLDEDRLWLGNGDGTFTAASDRMPGMPRQPSNGAVACDYDSDGDMDIVVSTYSVSTSYGLNHLWENDGTGHFTNVAVERGVASLPTGNTWLASTGYGTEHEPGAAPGTYIGSNGFGVDCADVTGDGHPDILLATISHPVASDYTRKWSDPSQLLVNLGPDAGFSFANAWTDRGLPFNEGDIDAATVDFDNDGRLDLSLTRDTKYESGYDDDPQKAWFGLFHQRPDGTFAGVGLDSGINAGADDPWQRMKGGQNHAWSDIDADGDLDLLVGGRDQGGGRPNFLFENTVGQDNRWLQVRLVGDGIAVNRDALGARLTLRDDGVIRVREVRGGRGTYNSEDGRVVQLGLHDTGRDAVLEIRWPDGTAVDLRAGRDFGDAMRLVVTYPDTVDIW